MKTGCLKTPIRIYWDLPHGELRDCIDVSAIARQIMGLKILSLDITLSEASTDLCRKILLELAGVPIAVSLTLPLVAAASETLDLPLCRPIKDIYLAVAGSQDLAEVDGVAGRTSATGLSLRLTPDNYLQLPEILSFCAERGYSLVLPMQRLGQGEEPFMLNRNERDRLSDKIGAVRKSENMKIVIHDPFLWRVFYPGTGFPQGGCQAADTMLAIASDGHVYPCPSLPISLGNLSAMALDEIAHSAEKRGVREKLTALPTYCGSCPDLQGCFGGCRGRAYCATGEFERPDPGCR